MGPARADASVDATLTCGLPAESIVTLGTDVLTPGEAVTTCMKHQHFYELINTKHWNPNVFCVNIGRTQFFIKLLIISSSVTVYCPT
jgi:hypothetical protein